MTDRITLTLHNAQQGHTELLRSWTWCKAMLTAGHRLTLTAAKATRSTEQNSKLWAMLTEVSQQVVWHGQKLGPDDWKHIFTASLTKQRVAPGLDGGFVVLGQSTSKMTKGEMSELIELMHAFGAQQSVKFSDDPIDPETGEVYAASHRHA